MKYFLPVLILLVQVASAESGNIVDNPSFENNFDSIEVVSIPDNGEVKTWVDTENVHSGNKSFHWKTEVLKTEAGDTTNLSLSYLTNYFAVSDSVYIEAGYWGFPISNAYGHADVTIHFWDGDNKYLGRLWGQDPLGDLGYRKWSRMSFLWYPASTGVGDGYIPAGAKKARLRIYCNYHKGGVGERIDDDIFVRTFAHLPSVLERTDKDLTNITLTVDYNKIIGKSILSYSAHPPIWADEFRTGGRGKVVWDTIRKLKFSKMRFQSGYLFNSDLWFGPPVCTQWDTVTGTSAENNFENWTVKTRPDNGYVKIRPETGNVKSGGKALYFRTEAPTNTELSLSYYSDYFQIEEDKYYMAGFHSYMIQGNRGYDLTLHFYDKDRKFLARVWGRDDTGGFALGEWKRISSLWYPSSFKEERGGIPEGAKYAKLNVYVNWHRQGIIEGIDDDIFTVKKDFKPADYERGADIVDNLIPNPSFERKTFGYDWMLLDATIEAIKQVGGEPIVCLPVGTWGNANCLPEGFPLNKSVYVEFSIDQKGYFPEPDAYGKLVRDVVYHVNVEKKYGVRYWEIGNEPPLSAEKGDTVIRTYIELFNTAEKSMHGVDSGILIGCDRSDFRFFMDNYFVKYAENPGFLSFHNYDIWGTCMYPYNQKNTENRYYPPDNKSGWMKDEYIMSGVNDLGNLHVYSPKETKEFWKKSRGQELEVINTELNMNSAWRNGSDPRMNNLLGAVWYATKARAYILDGGTSVINYFDLMSSDEKSRTSKYGGFGFGMIGAVYPYIPYAPYWTNYLLTRFVPEGCLIYSAESSCPEAMDILAVKTADSYNILILNKTNISVEFVLRIDGLEAERAELYVLDSSSYVQKYDPSIDKTIIQKSGIRTVKLDKANIRKIHLDGYSVAVLHVVVK